MIGQIRRWVWYERGAGFAEHGLWAMRPVAFIQPHGGWLIVGVLFFFLFIGTMLTPLYDFLDRWSVLAPVTVSVGPLLFFGSRVRRVDRAMKGSVVQTRGLVCPRCLYDLSGVGPVSACPECGQSVDLELLPRQWARTVRALRYPDGDREAVRGWLDV